MFEKVGTEISVSTFCILRLGLVKELFKFTELKTDKILYAKNCNH